MSHPCASNNVTRRERPGRRAQSPGQRWSHGTAVRPGHAMQPWPRGPGPWEPRLAPGTTEASAGPRVPLPRAAWWHRSPLSFPGSHSGLASRSRGLCRAPAVCPSRPQFDDRAARRVKLQQGQAHGSGLIVLWHRIAGTFVCRLLSSVMGNSDKTVSKQNVTSVPRPNAACAQ